MFTPSRSMLQKPNRLADSIEALSDREALRPVGPKRFAILPNPLLGLVRDLSRAYFA